MKNVPNGHKAQGQIAQKDIVLAFINGDLYKSQDKSYY